MARSPAASGDKASRTPAKRKRGAIQVDSDGDLRETNNKAASKELASLPGVWIRELLDGHECLCDVCSPAYHAQVEKDTLRRIQQDMVVTLKEETRHRILAEVTATCQKELAGELEELRAVSDSCHQLRRLKPRKGKGQGKRRTTR